MTDHASRFVLMREALESTREQLAFTAFERLFCELGLPAAIRSDNGVPFASPNALFNLSRLSVWWLRPGVEIERIKPGRLLTRRKTAKKASTIATDKGRIERHIKPLLGAMKVAAVTREDVEDFLHAVAVRHVVKLYCCSGLFLCCRCHRLAYQSQSEDVAARAQRRAGKIRQRLGGNPDWAASFPPKPKGMWQRTYERMWRLHLEAEQRIDDAFNVGAAAAILRHMR